MKQCGKCLKKLPVSNFHNRSLSRDGKFLWCKSCKNKVEAARKRRVGKTPTGKAKKAWENMKLRCKNSPEYFHVKINVERDEFLEWAIPEYEKFMTLNPNAQPSIDRIDSDGHYEIGNIRVVSINDNCKENLSARLAKSVSLGNLKSVAKILQSLLIRNNHNIESLIQELRSL